MPNANILPEDDTTYVMGYMAELPYDGQQLHFYFGPNDLASLETTGFEEVGRIIDYGWWIFGWVNRNVILPVYDFVANYIGNMGLIILVLTLVIKSALFPITWKNYMSSAKMRVLGPELQRNQRAAQGRRHGAPKGNHGALPQDRSTRWRDVCLVCSRCPSSTRCSGFFPSNIDLRGQSFLCRPPGGF